ncbi:MAG: hypothetical protein RL220_397 [Bacteroidota bacterium]
MKVFKFGGASVRDSAAIRNVGSILRRYTGEKLVVVVSAMGKTTNALETIHDKRFKGEEYKSELDALIAYHRDICKEVVPGECGVFDRVLDEFLQVLSESPDADYDMAYDSVVSFGELMSTAIVTDYLNSQGQRASMADAREIVITGEQYREGKVDWERTSSNAPQLIQLLESAEILICQGFIGTTLSGHTVTLGREGSDFTAAILAYILNAESVTIWKDVPGMMNADPRRYPDAVLLEKISYREAIELAYFGASVIHPKTVKPLQNKGIPLYVKSFIHPEEPGTVIQKDAAWDAVVPGFIFKDDQVLLSITPRDFSFVVEENLREIFEALAESNVRINLMENSALSFSICVDKNERRISKLKELLNPHYEIRYNESVTLLTIRHGNEQTIKDLAKGREILIEQLSRNTARLVLR